MFVVGTIISVNGTMLSVLSVLAWGGAISTVAAYALVSRRRLSATSVSFQGINSVGAALLGLNAMVHGNWTSAASNGVWLVVGLQALAVIAWTRRPAATVHPLQPTPPATPELTLVEKTAA